MRSGHWEGGMLDRPSLWALTSLKIAVNLGVWGSAVGQAPRSSRMGVRDRGPLGDVSGEEQNGCQSWGACLRGAGFSRKLEA